MFEKITIIGCGLIGSSILRNINNTQISKSISVFDKSKNVVETIKKENLCSNVSKDIQSAVKDSDLVSNDKIEILMKGGLLCVELNKEKNLFSDIWLSGEVNMVFKGVYNKFES